MPFVKFEGANPRSFTRDPALTLNKSGVLYLNHPAVTAFKLSEYEYATLFYDTEKQAIGIKATNNFEEASVRIGKSGRGYSMSGRAFLHHYNIDHSKRRQYNLTYSKEHDMLIASLTKPI